MSRTPRIGKHIGSLLIAASLGLALFGACSSDGQPNVSAPEVSAPDVSAPDVTAPDVTAPDITAPDATAPAQTPEPAPAAGGDTTTGEVDDGLTDSEWVLLIVLGVVVIGLIMGATAMASNHSGKKQGQKANLQRRLDDVTGSCRWVVDQGAPSVLQATSADQAVGAWNPVRGKMIDLEGQIAQLSSGSGDSRLDQLSTELGQGVAGLRSALDSYVSALPAGQADLIDASRQTAMQRRQQLDAVLQRVMTVQP